MKVNFNTYRPYSQQTNNRTNNTNNRINNINSNTIANTKHVAFGYDGCDFDVYDPDAPDTYSILDFFNLFKKKHVEEKEDFGPELTMDDFDDEAKARIEKVINADREEREKEREEYGDYDYYDAFDA